MMMTSKTGSQLTNNKNIDTSDASEFPALVSCKKIEFRDDVSVSSVSDESVCSRKSAFTQTTFWDVLEDVGRTNRLRKEIADEKRRCYEEFEIYEGPHNVKLPETPVVLPRRTIQEVFCHQYLEDRLDNVHRLIRKGARVDVNGFEEFSNGDVWFRLEKPLKGWWIPAEAVEIVKVKSRVCPVRHAAQPQTPVQVVTSTWTKAVSEFAFGETVECFVNDAWRRGDVVSRQPLRVCVDGRTYEGRQFAVRKIMGKTFLCTTSIPVHSMKETRRGVTEKLDVDTEIEVVALEGVWAKIHKPCVGWIQWRKDGGQIHLRGMSVITEMVVTVSNFREDCDMETAQPAYELLRNTFRDHRIKLASQGGYRMVDGDGERLMEIYLPAHMYALEQAHVMMNRSRTGTLPVFFEKGEVKELFISVGSIDLGFTQHSV